MRSLTLLLLVAALALVPTELFAQQDKAELYAHIKKTRETYLVRRDAALETRLVMDDRQAKKFRGLKKKFDGDMEALNRSSTDLVLEFNEVHARLTLETADVIAQRFFELQRKKLAIQQDYFERISNEVSPVIAVQFIQLQRRFDLEIQRMTYSPLAE